MAKLVPDITRWKEGKVGEVKLLSGHGCKYIFKMGKMTRPNCIYADALMDDKEKSFFQCERWRLERRNLEVIVENFCDVILSREENWNRMANYNESLL